MKTYQILVQKRKEFKVFVIRVCNQLHRMKSVGAGLQLGEAELESEMYLQTFILDGIRVSTNSST